MSFKNSALHCFLIGLNNHCDFFLSSKKASFPMIYIGRLGNTPTQKIIQLTLGILLTISICSLYTMICQRCTRLLSSSLLRSTSLRPISTTSGLLHPENPPPATSTSAAQPFSTPFTPSPSKTPDLPSSPNSTNNAASKGPAHPPSSVPAGTPLRGLGYIKGQEGPVARKDSEYPDWLWGLLGPKPGDITEEGMSGDAFGKLRLSATATTGSPTYGTVCAVKWLQLPRRWKPFLCSIVASRLSG